MHVDMCLHVRVLAFQGKRQEVLAMSLIQLQEPAEKHRKVGRSPQWGKRFRMTLLVVLKSWANIPQ